MKMLCDNCDVEFEKASSQVKKTKRHFCSKSCAASVNNRLYPKRMAKVVFCNVCGKEAARGKRRCETHTYKKRKITSGCSTDWKNRPLEYKLANNLRTRLNAAIKNGTRAGSAVDNLGCTIDELKKYLESQFEEGMSWENWARDGWHIDHIQPLSTFDLSDLKQLKKACHYTNLQPLWSKDNLRKGNT